MGMRGNKVKTLKSRYDPIVYTRDRGRCFVDVHEIISKSQFSTRELERCIAVKNMVALCRKHHAIVQGNKQASAKLLRSLRDIYGYEYTADPFKWYIEEE